MPLDAKVDPGEAPRSDEMAPSATVEGIRRCEDATS